VWRRKRQWQQETDAAACLAKFVGPAVGDQPLGGTPAGTWRQCEHFGRLDCQEWSSGPWSPERAWRVVGSGTCLNSNSTGSRMGRCSGPSNINGNSVVVACMQQYLSSHACVVVAKLEQLAPACTASQVIYVSWFCMAIFATLLETRQTRLCLQVVSCIAARTDDATACGQQS